jgi:hypothetical protein
MKALLLILLAITFALAADRIASFSDCVRNCRKDDGAFASCVSSCKRQISIKNNGTTLVMSDAVGDVPDSKDLWHKYRSVLRDFLRQGNANLFPGLQLVPQPFAADWDEDISILYNLANRLPKPGQAYEQSVYELSTEYGNFITDVILSNDKPIDQTKLRAVRNELSAVDDLIDEAETFCAEQYDTKSNRRSPSLPTLPPYPEYERVYCKDVEEHKATRTSILYKYELLRREEFGEHMGLKDSVLKYSDARSKGSFKFTALGSMARFVEAAKAQRTAGFEVKINQYTKTSTEKTSSMSIDVGFKYDFISVGVGYQRSSFKLTTQTRDFQLTVGAAGYKYIPVFPERSWFAPEVIYKYGRYPVRSGKDYFGPSGPMHLIPKGFVVVVGPKITMLVNKEDASQVEKSSGLKLNLNIGGFDFNFGKNASVKRGKEEGNLVQITVEGNSYEPQVLAVDNWIPTLDMK